jgi:hypothetical protein
MSSIVPYRGGAAKFLLIPMSRESGREKRRMGLLAGMRRENNFLQFQLFLLKIVQGGVAVSVMNVFPGKRYGYGVKYDGV